MIESEEKRQRITEDIQRWCEHVKATPLLRDYDIPSLVGTILDEFYPVRLCCGHLVRSINEGVHIAFKSFSDGEVCEVSGGYCKECAEKYIKELGAREVKDALV